MSIGEGIQRNVKPRARPVLVCGESLTKQAFKDQVNINKIIAKYNKTGMINHLSSRPGFYGDVSHIRSYQESLAVVQEAQELFAGLSAEVRARFGNDPEQMIVFLSDEKNRDEAVKLGLVKGPEPEPRPARVVLVDEAGKPVGAAKSPEAGSKPS